MKMNITIKPFTKEYADKCSDLLQYLWKEDVEERKKHFEWEYLRNPNCKDKTLAIIAVDDNDDVMGFRGFYILSFLINSTKQKIALLSDTVVSPNLRRQGLFQRTTEFSFTYLKENGINAILNLTPSWPPYHGYKKMGFEDLNKFRSVYKLSLLSLFSKLVLKQTRINEFENEHFFLQRGVKYILNSTFPEIIRNKTLNKCSNDKIESIKDHENLLWKSEHPDANYIYAYALDNEGNLLAFFWFKTKDYYIFNFGLQYSTNTKIAAQLFKYFSKSYKPALVAAWSFAILPEDRKLFRKLGLFEIPFINKFRKNPPSLIKTLKTNKYGELDWLIENVDIRNINNWVINKFDGDSF